MELHLCSIPLFILGRLLLKRRLVRLRHFSPHLGRYLGDGLIRVLLSDLGALNGSKVQKGTNGVLGRIRIFDLFLVPATFRAFAIDGHISSLMVVVVVIVMTVAIGRVHTTGSNVIVVAVVVVVVVGLSIHRCHHRWLGDGRYTDVIVVAVVVVVMSASTTMSANS